MAVEEVLKKLADYGVKKGYFTYSLVGKLHKSCCSDSEIEVIDFDKTEVRHRGFGFDPLKSCDALKIMPSKERIDFIEMKSLNNYLKHQRPNTKEEFEDFITGLDFACKIRDSIKILSNIIDRTGNNFTKDQKLVYSKSQKYFIILVDINLEENPLEELMLGLNYLAHFSSDLKLILKDVIENIGLDHLNSLNKPILKDCKSFEKYYN